MTKTQISVRVDPATLAAIDAAARAGGVSRGHVIDRWLAAQAAAATSPCPATWHRVGLLVAQARDYAGTMEYTDAIHRIADAIDVLAGTAPEEG